MPSVHEFGPVEKAGLYAAIYGRRDVRGQFLPDPVPDGLLARLLDAAHHAGSVGFMQPWNFVLVRDPAVKVRVKALFDEANSSAAEVYAGERQVLYRRLKLQGILEAPVNLCVTCDPTRGGPHVLGRHTISATDIYSTCCAIQNLWLAARAEGLGVGWVSILTEDGLRGALGIPPHVIPVAYLCVGYVGDFLPRPELETVGWRERLPLRDLVFTDRWGEPPSDLFRMLLQQMEQENHRG